MLINDVQNIKPVAGKNSQNLLHQETILQRAVKEAICKAGVVKHIGCLTFRHYAIHLLEGGSDIRTVEKIWEHSDVKSTMIYTHIRNLGPMGVRSPVDGL
ncbi:MAG: tyrosine-type recombinase/integrase [Pseudomonadota bacterium]